MSTYKVFDKDQAQFCQKLYHESDTYYPTERKTSLFKKNYHDCLLAAGQPRGWQYCDDTYGLGDAYDAESLYECYETYRVDQLLYAEDKCLTEQPPIFGIEECNDDLTSFDTNEVSCTPFHDNPSLCGKDDTDDFKSLEMCCACNGGIKGYVDMTPE